MQHSLDTWPAPTYSINRRSGLNARTFSGPRQNTGFLAWTRLHAIVQFISDCILDCACNMKVHCFDSNHQRIKASSLWTPFSDPPISISQTRPSFMYLPIVRSDDMSLQTHIQEIVAELYMWQRGTQSRKKIRSAPFDYCIAKTHSYQKYDFLSCCTNLESRSHLTIAIVQRYACCIINIRPFNTLDSTWVE
jgi:hypothetical protein